MDGSGLRGSGHGGGERETQKGVEEMGEVEGEGEGGERKKTYHVVLDSHGMDGSWRQHGQWRLVVGCERERERGWMPEIM